MKKIICAALAATMCMSVGLMANATDVESNSPSTTSCSDDGLINDGYTRYRDSDYEPEDSGAIYGTSEIEEDSVYIPADPLSKNDNDDSNIPKSEDLIPGPNIVKNSDATTSATPPMTIVDLEEDPMSQGTSELYAADGGIGFGAKYYNNTGLRHKKGNANKYIMTAEEWQRILDKDEDSNPQTNDMIRVRFYFDELRYEMFEGDTLLHEYNYADAGFIDVLKSIVGVVAPSSASIVMPDSEIHFVQANPQLTSESQDFKVDADVNSYIYYANGHLCLHYNRLLPGEDVGNARFYMNYKYTKENGDSTSNREAIILNPTVETNIELMPMTEYEYNHLDTFNIQYVLSGINMKWTFEFNQRELTSTTGEPRLG